MDNKNLDALLEYQKVDIQLKRALDELERNDDNKKMEQAKAEFNNAKTQVMEAEKYAEKIVDFYKNALNYYEETAKKIDDTVSSLNDADETQAIEIIAQLEKLREKLIDLEGKVKTRKDKADEVISVYKKSQERGNKLRALYNDSKEKFMTFKSGKEPAINQLKEKLSVMSKDIDANLLETYASLTAEKKYPAFVEATLNDDKKSYRCYCGLSLSQKTQGELLESGFCRCETCRRVIFKK